MCLFILKRRETHWLLRFTPAMMELEVLLGGALYITDSHFYLFFYPQKVSSLCINSLVEIHPVCTCLPVGPAGAEKCLSPEAAVRQKQGYENGGREKNKERERSRDLHSV